MQKKRKQPNKDKKTTMISVPLDDIKLTLRDWYALQKACQMRGLCFPKDLGLLAEIEISATLKR